MAQDPYIVTTNPATDILETSAKLHGYVFFRVKIDDCSLKWINDYADLQATLTYTDDLMADVSGVVASQFEIETGNGNVNPNSINKGAANELLLVFTAYSDALIGQNKTLTYTQSITEAERLKCSDNEDVITGDSVTREIPELIPSTADVYFEFNSGTNTITKYYPTGVGEDQPLVVDPVIPVTIGGVAVKNLGQDAFRYGASYIGEVKLQSVTFKEGLEDIGNGTFRDQNQLTSLILPNSVTRLQHWCFLGATFTEVEFGEGLEEINAGAWTKIDIGIDTMTVPASLKTVFHGFRDTALTCGSLVIPEVNSLETLGQFVFNGQSALTGTIHLPNILTIGRETFRDSALEGVVIGSSLTSLGLRAFTDADISGDVFLPNSLTNFSTGYAFQGNTAIDIVWDTYTTERTLGNYMFQNAGLSGAITIPVNMCGGQFAFANNSGITSVTFEHTRIHPQSHGYQFTTCTGITTVDFGPISFAGVGLFTNSPITHITIGADFDWDEAQTGQFGTYGEAFKTKYTDEGKAAGVYEYIAEAWSKTA